MDYYELAAFQSASSEHVYLRHTVYPTEPYAKMNAATSLVSIEEPALPRIVAPVDEFAELRDLTLLGQLGLLATWSSDLQVLDLSDPARPAVVAELHPAADLVAVEYDAEADRKHAFALSEERPGRVTSRVAATTTFQVIDVTDPRAPAIVGAVKLAHPHDQLAVSDNTAYVGGRGPVHIVDIRDPRQPTAIGAIPLDEMQVVCDLAVHRSKLLVATLGSLLVLDISNPLAPVLDGTWPGGCTQIIGLDERHVLTAADQLAVLDVGFAGNPVARAVLDSFDYVPPHAQEEDAPRFHGVAVVGEHVYGRLSLLGSDQGLLVVRLHRPSAP
jgi:hypothetical protein